MHLCSSPAVFPLRDPASPVLVALPLPCLCRTFFKSLIFVLFMVTSDMSQVSVFFYYSEGNLLHLPISNFCLTLPLSFLYRPGFSAVTIWVSQKNLSLKVPQAELTSFQCLLELGEFIPRILICKKPEAHSHPYTHFTPVLRCHVTRGFHFLHFQRSQCSSLFWLLLPRAKLVVPCPQHACGSSPTFLACTPTWF